MSVTVSDYNQNAIAAGDAEGLTLLGRTAHLLRSPRDASGAYNQAEKGRAAARVETLLARAGRCFLDNYDPGHAEQVVKESALHRAPRRRGARGPGRKSSSPTSSVFPPPRRRGRRSARSHDAKHAGRSTSRPVWPYGRAIWRAPIARSIARSRPSIQRRSCASSRPRPPFGSCPTTAAASRRSGRPYSQRARNTRVNFYRIASASLRRLAASRHDEIAATDERSPCSSTPGTSEAWAGLGMDLIRTGDEQGGLSALRRAWNRPFQRPCLQYVEPL